MRALVKLAWLFLGVFLAACQSSAPASIPKRTKTIESVEKQNSSPADSSRCSYCSREIAGKYVIYEAQSYHRPCYFKVAPRCGICRLALLGSVTVLGDKHAYHPKCFQASHRCDACSLPCKGKRGGRIDIADGRIHCRQCDSTSIRTLSRARSALATAMLDLSRELGIDLRSTPIELKLQDRHSLARLAQVPSPMVKGFTEARRKDITVAGRLHRGPWKFKILALHSLPQEAMIGVMAHELFHVWQVLNCPDQTPQLREGSANYAQWRVLRRRQQWLWAELIEKDPDPVYGDGFRRFRRWCEASTWSRRSSVYTQLEDFPSGN
jgi:hypothetical protein